MLPSLYVQALTETRFKGPIVRINVRELHIKDSQYYGNIYTGSSRRVNKDSATVAAFPVTTAVAATVDHNIHRARRGYLNPYFSKRVVVDLEPLIHDRIGRLCARLEKAMQQGQVTILDSAFSALAADIITQRFYGEHFDYLGIQDFKFSVRETFIAAGLVYHFSRFFPSVVASLKSLPLPILRWIAPGVADIETVREQIKHNILTSLDEKRSTNSKSVIVSALADPNIPAKERTIDRLLDEGTTFIFAGTETSARALSVTMFHLLNNKSNLRKLRDELDTLPPRQGNAYSLSQLEPLPYLTGVVNEGFRLSFGPVSRLPRVATHETLRYKDYLIPAGTPVSQSSYFVHTDPLIYPNPFSFEPTRWIKAAQEGITLNKFLVSFTKGSRQCIGINMAYAELYLTIARIVRSFEMDLYETTPEDLEIYHVRLVGCPRKGGDVKVTVTGKIG
ncbi:putative cytochrome p450 [Phaeomoniella chlamydospora]|uniref:Putative cytochrome p450 n=1 Tax=Phaeomoniella chlamydospora TaxID=158046 RepID=A0A0G2EQC3_PHACM|nr:putative cytochrome p450 [Phaeomoniella chlamydospora]